MKSIIKKIGSLLFCCLPLLLSLGIQLLISIPITFYYIIFKTASSSAGDINTILNDVINSMLRPDFQVPVTVTWAVCGIFVFWFWLHKKKNQRDILPIRKAFSPLILFSIPIITLGMLLAISYTCHGLEQLHPEWFDNYNFLMKQTTGGSLFSTLLMTFYAVLIGPLHEELIFRGVTLYYAKKSFPFWFANIIQAILFGALHMNLVQGLYAFAAGLILGYVAYRGKNLWIAVLLHVLFNLSSSLLGLHPLSGNVFLNFLAALIGGILLLMGCILYDTGVKNRSLPIEKSV